MKINPRKKPDLAQKCDCPTTGWRNQNHVLLQGMGLEKITFAKSRSDYATDIAVSFLQINRHLVGAARRGVPRGLAPPQGTGVDAPGYSQACTVTPGENEGDYEKENDWCSSVGSVDLPLLLCDGSGPDWIS